MTSPAFVGAPFMYTAKSMTNSRRFAGQMSMKSRSIGLGKSPPPEAIWVIFMHCGGSAQLFFLSLKPHWPCPCTGLEPFALVIGASLKPPNVFRIEISYWRGDAPPRQRGQEGART